MSPAVFPVGAEYSIDMAMYGPMLAPGADFRSLSEVIYRSTNCWAAN